MIRVTGAAAGRAFFDEPLDLGFRRELEILRYGERNATDVTQRLDGAIAGAVDDAGPYARFVDTLNAFNNNELCRHEAPTAQTFTDG